MFFIMLVLGQQKYFPVFPTECYPHTVHLLLSAPCVLLDTGIAHGFLQMGGQTDLLLY